MMKSTKFLLHLYVLVLLVSVSACGGANVAPTAMPATPQQEPATTTAADVPPAADAPASASTPDDEPIQLITVEDASTIISYRTRVDMTATRTDQEGATHVLLEGAYIKDPRAAHLKATFEEPGQPVQTLEMIIVEDASYISADEQWIQTNDADLFNLDDVTLLTPKQLAGSTAHVTRAGEETVNGRQTIHYQGGKEAILQASAGSDSFDVSDVDSVTLDLWVDATEHFIVKFQLAVENENDNGLGETFNLVYEYLDFNASLAIQAPENALTLEMPPPDAGDLNAILGFNLELPAEASVSFMAGGRAAVIVLPMDLQESVTFLQTAMEANGYTLLTSTDVSATQTVQAYEQGSRIVSATLFTNQSGGTTLNLASQ